MLSGETGSTIHHLEGSLSGTEFDCDQLIGLDPTDGRPLLARYDLERATAAISPQALNTSSRRGLWAWHALLPVRRWEHVTSLGEGGTPLLSVPRLGRHLGHERISLKLESLNPTGSFKARGMAVAVSRAVELGARRLVTPSAGNAAGALAAYAAAASVGATVIMPADAPEANKIEVAVTGARLVLMDGLLPDCGRLARVLADELDAFDLSTLKEPYRLEGKKTMAYELACQRDWRLPDVVVYPTGGGTGLVAMAKAFDELEQIGLIDSNRPRIVSVQSDGCAPIVRAFVADARFAEPWPDASTDAAGMRVPSAVGDFLILDAIRSSGGTAVAVPEEEIRPMQRRIGERGGGFASLETAAAVLATETLIHDGFVEHDEEVVVFDTGAGFKSAMPEIVMPRAVGSDGEGWDELVSVCHARAEERV